MKILLFCTIWTYFRPRVEHPLVQRIVGLGGLNPHRQNPFLGIQRPPGPLTAHADKPDLKGKKPNDQLGKVYYIVTIVH